MKDRRRPGTSPTSIVPRILTGTGNRFRSKSNLRCEHRVVDEFLQSIVGHHRCAKCSCDSENSIRSPITRSSREHTFMHLREIIRVLATRSEASAWVRGSLHEDPRARPTRKQPQYLAMIVQIKRESIGRPIKNHAAAQT